MTARDSLSLVQERRRWLKAVTSLGVGTAVFQRALAAQIAESDQPTADMIRNAEWISGFEMSDEDRAATAASLQRVLVGIREMRKHPVGYDVAPALTFFAAPTATPGDSAEKGVARPIESAPPERPSDDAALARLPVTELAALLRSRAVTSTELTKIYLQRLKKYGPALKCVVTLTEELALRQAERADREIAAGHYRGPLHGMPWGAKDLIAYPGYPTTWGAPPFREQVIDEPATVARRLDEAGAVLLAKLSLGALAQGDRWFGGQTRSPWNPTQGSSGSSAGSAAATAAGLAAFTLGSETLGSIVSPCRRCGTTGLRPTFGRVSRHGCMTLSWSMDKIGPITRSVEDCALVLSVIQGSDGRDAAAVDRPFSWPPQRDLSSMRVGYFSSRRTPDDEREDLAILRRLGVQLVPMELPSGLPLRALTIILDVDSATAFDTITRDGITEGLNSWPRTFRRAQYIPAVEYVRANRVRTLLMRAMEEQMRRVDAYIGGSDLLITNMTGHPTVVIPTEFRTNGDWFTPRTVSFTGQLFGESDLLALAHAYQRQLTAHLEHPPLDRVLEFDRQQSESPE